MDGSAAPPPAPDGPQGPSEGPPAAPPPSEPPSYGPPPSERAPSERSPSERSPSERPLSEPPSYDRAAYDREAYDRASYDRAADDRAADEQAADEQASGQARAAEQQAAEPPRYEVRQPGGPEWQPGAPEYGTPQATPSEPPPPVTNAPPVNAAPLNAPVGPPSRNKQKPWLVPVLIGVAAVLVLCCVGGSAIAFLAVHEATRDKSFTVTGDLTLDAGGEGITGDACFGMGGYSDINQGTEVTVSDDSGKTLGTGQLGAGKAQDQLCVFDFSVPKVAKGAKFYGVTVAERGTVRFSADAIEKPVHLTLGG